jgi:hypothetical protein
MYWYLKQLKTDLNVLTISTVEQEDITSLSSEYFKAADFIICVPANMTKTY